MVYTHTHTHTHTHTMEYYSAIKNEIMPLAATWMDLEIIIIGEVSPKEKDKYMTSLICRILKGDTNELNIQSRSRLRE